MPSVHMKSSLIEDKHEKKTEFHKHKKKKEFNQTQQRIDIKLVILLISAIAIVIFDVIIFMQNGIGGFSLTFLLSIICVVTGCFLVRFFIDIYIERKLSIKEEEAIKQVVRRMTREDRGIKDSNTKEHDRFKHGIRVSPDSIHREEIKHHARNALVRLFHKQGS